MEDEMRYDEEEDILVLSKGKKVKHSVDIGDFVVDIGFEGFVVGLEILNASQNLRIPTDKFKLVKETNLTATYKPDYVHLLVILEFEGKEKDITIPLKLDLGHEVLKTEKTCFAAV